MEKKGTVGSFSAKAKRKGMTTLQYARWVMKNSKDAKLRKQGVDPAVEPDQYYKVIDERLRTVFPDYFDGAPVREQVSRKSVVAPATRGGKSPRKVTLTSTQMNLAKKLGVTPEQYAQEVAKQEMAHG